MTISEILRISYKPAYEEMLGGRRFWPNEELNILGREGRLLIKTLAATVVVMVSGEERNYPVREVAVPMIWTDLDEVTYDTEDKKIRFIRGLIVNGVNSMSDLLLEKIGDGCAIASREYRYDLGPTAQVGGLFVAKIYTAICFIN